MQWFKTLGVMSLNCAQLTMSFQHLRETVTLHWEQDNTSKLQASQNLKLDKSQLKLVVVQVTNFLQTTLWEDNLSHEISSG